VEQSVGRNEIAEQCEFFASLAWAHSDKRKIPNTGSFGGVRNPHRFTARADKAHSALRFIPYWGKN